jgi:hypothetical protein
MKISCTVGRRCLVDNAGIALVVWSGGGSVLLSIAVVSVPSSGSRKAIDSCRLPTGEVYTPNPNESSGNAVGTVRGSCPCRYGVAVSKTCPAGRTGIAPLAPISAANTSIYDRCISKTGAVCRRGGAPERSLLVLWTGAVGRRF